MSSVPPTRKARDLLEFIREYAGRNGGIAPSFDEMASALDLRSKSGIARLLDQLEERGHIHRLANRSRAIEIAARADAIALDAQTEAHIRILAERSGITPAAVIARAVDTYAVGPSA